MTLLHEQCFQCARWNKYQVTDVTVIGLEPLSNLKVAHFSFRTEVKEKAAELDILKDTMASEQKKSREVQWALEKEKAKMERSEERGREELEVFHNPKWPGTSRSTQIFFG